MSEPQAPGGLSWTRFKALSLDAGEWLWGTAEGSFNQKASASQIIVDAVIGMIPLVGDVTAVRDLIAVTINMSEDPKKREDVWEWALLAVLIFALIPVLGGVLKGSGRLVLRAARTTEATEKVAKDIIEFLNRFGHGNAEKWLKALKFSDYADQAVAKLGEYVNTICEKLDVIKNSATGWISSSWLQRIEALKKNLAALKDEASKRIPEGIKKLDEKLREIQAFIHSGGDTTSRVASHSAETGDRALSYAEEARLNGGEGARITSRQGLAQNDGVLAKTDKIKKVYEPADGYPNLLTFTNNENTISTGVAAYSGKIINRELEEGEQLFRFFGPEGATRGETIGASNPFGAWWGLGKPPKTAKEWRETCAVLDEFNRDGFIVTTTVTKDAKLKAVVGKVSEQNGSKLAGQYLPGGGTQAVIYMSPTIKELLGNAGKEVVASGVAKEVIDHETGLLFRIEPTGWKDANGIHGYATASTTEAVGVAKVATKEKAEKPETTN